MVMSTASVNSPSERTDISDAEIVPIVRSCEGSLWEWLKNLVFAYLVLCSSAVMPT